MDSDSRRTPARGPGPGRPRLTLEELLARIAAYCDRYDVKPADAGGLPPFPSGRREMAQHREWMALYKAHRRLQGRAATPNAEDPNADARSRDSRPQVSGAEPIARAGRPRTPSADLEARRQLLAAQRGRCPICDRTLELAEGCLDDGASHGPAVLHARCLDLVEAGRALGPAALDRARRRL